MKAFDEDEKSECNNDVMNLSKNPFFLKKNSIMEKK